MRAHGKLLRHALPVEVKLADTSDLREDVTNRLAADAR